MSAHKSATGTKLAKQAATKGKPIDITDKKGKVSKATEHISKENAEEIVWESTTGTASVVCFCKNGSPFSDWMFVVPAGGSVNSGVPIVASGSKKYKYLVVGQDGSTDPVIIVDK